MPSGLQFATFCAAMMSLSAPLSLLPYGEYRIDDIEVTFAEFWSRGGGPILFGFGVFWAVLTYGFLRARRWSRHLFVFATTSLSVLAVFSDPAERLDQIAVTLAFTILAYWYMFRRRSVRDYFLNASEEAP